LLVANSLLLLSEQLIALLQVKLFSPISRVHACVISAMDGFCKTDALALKLFAVVLLALFVLHLVILLLLV